MYTTDLKAAIKHEFAYQLEQVEKASNNVADACLSAVLNMNALYTKMTALQAEYETLGRLLVKWLQQPASES